MLVYCRQVLDGSVAVKAALDCMQNACNQINIDYRRAPQNIVDHLRDTLRREYRG